MLKNTTYPCKILKTCLSIAILVAGMNTISLASEDIPDPLEPVNRGIFWFNNQIDEFVVEPVAKGYNYVVPDALQKSIKNFFQNLNTPVYVVSDILQLKLNQAGTHLGRFAINTTIGGLGFFDMAESWDMKHHEEDLGSAFGYWGIGQGAYLVLPILGPSSIRDGIGFAGETFLSPTLAITYSNMKQRDKNAILFGANTLRFINIRSRLIDTINSAKDASLDYYSFVKHAYQQNRQSVIYDGMAPDSEDYENE